MIEKAHDIMRSLKGRNADQRRKCWWGNAKVQVKKEKKGVEVIKGKGEEFIIGMGVKINWY